MLVGSHRNGKMRQIRHGCRASARLPAEPNTLLSGLGFESGGLAVAHAVHNGITEIPTSHDFIHAEKVTFGLLTQLVLEGQPQTEINEILRDQKAVG